ncbi:MAG: uridine kinase, partial [Actinobacteria bacterium]|nr:uridine kinase [Actinomycetota bacterium]
MIVVQPSTPAGVVDAIVSLISSRPGRLRVAIDGAPAAAPENLAEQVVLELVPRNALLVRAHHFWRQASLRLEDGRHDADAWLDHWLDEAALRREVLDPCAEGRPVLPALRDPVTDRSLRSSHVELPPDGVVIVAGSVLLGRSLPFDVAIHVQLTQAALARRTPEDQSWTLPALARYERERNPAALADLVVRW